MKLADALVFLGTEDSGLKKGFDSAKQQTKTWAGGMGTIVQGAMMGVGMAITNGLINVARGAMDAIGDSVGAASDMNETVSKINTLFGDSSNSILQWSDKSAIAMGLSKQAALDAVGTLGNMFQQLGAGTEQAAGLSQEMTQMAADLSSFHNVAGGTPEVLEAMTAGFRGEYDALQRYIPTISAATVEQEALAMTGKATVKELTALDKALAVQSIVMKTAGAATGDFARTSEGLANQQRIAEAQTKNFSATIGTALLPVVLTFTTAYNNLAEKVFPLVTDFVRDKVVPIMVTLGEKLSNITQMLISGDFEGAWQLAKDMFGGVVDYVTTQLPVWVAKVGEWGVAAWQWIVDAIPVAVTKLGEWGVSLLGWVATNLPSWITKLGEWATAAWQWIIDAAKQVPAKLNEWWTTLTGWFNDNKQKWVNKLGEWGEKLWKWISDIFPKTTENLTAWWGVITKKFDEYQPLITKEINEWKEIINGLFGLPTQKTTETNAGTWFGKLIEKINGYGDELDLQLHKWALGLVQWITDSIPDTIRAATDWILGLGKGLDVNQNPQARTEMDRVTRELAAAIMTMLSTIEFELKLAALRLGWALVDGMRQGIENNWNGFVEWLKGNLQSITDLLPGSEPKDPNSPLRGLGKRGAALVTNFSDGAQAAMVQMRQSLTAELNLVAAGVGGAGGTVINNTYSNQLNLQGSGYAPSDALSAVQLLNMHYRNA